MKKLLSLFLLVVLGVQFVLADDGMWTYDNPPLKIWKEKYGFEPTAEWLEKIRLASVKIGGASGAFVSPNGLIATNHHVAAGMLSRLSTKERNLMDTGYYAKTNADELKVPGQEVRALVSYENVTARVLKAAESITDLQKASEARSNEMDKIIAESREATGLPSTIVTMYSGGEYWLYRFKVYTDIRIVMAPEEQAAYFGGDYDNFTFPRHDLDFTFLRAYENDKPAVTPNFIKWSEKGPTEDEFVIVSGFPGSTARLMTVAQLAYARDKGNPLLKASWQTRRNAMIEYGKLGEDQQLVAANTIRGLANSLKRLDGQQNGLLNPKMFAIKVAEENDLRTKLAAKKDENKKYASAWGDIEKAYTELPKHSPTLTFGGIDVSRLGSFASSIVRYHSQIKLPEAERSAEFRGQRLENFKKAAAAKTNVDLDQEEIMLKHWLKEAEQQIGPNSAYVKAVFGGKSAEEVAKNAVRNTKMGDEAFRMTLVNGTQDELAKSNDPMVKLALAAVPFVDAARNWSSKNVEAVDEASGIKIAQARFAVYGKTMPPDANSNLRISFGVVSGYEEDTTLVPYKTTFYGLYDRALSFNEKEPYQLTDSLRNRKNNIDLATPLNFVYSADTIGGNSGSPVINRKGELVGLNFDSNRQKLSNRYWYIPDVEGSRAVAVHSAGVVEALKKIYDAEELLQELLAK